MSNREKVYRLSIDFTHADEMQEFVEEIQENFNMVDMDGEVSNYKLTVHTDLQDAECEIVNHTLVRTSKNIPGVYYCEDKCLTISVKEL